MSGLRADGLGNDNLFTLMYAASSKQGALSILRSKASGKHIRVFRSTVLNSVFRATSEEKSPARYRFDGLYEVAAVKYQEEVEHVLDVEDPAEHFSSRIPDARIYLFDLARVEHGDGLFANRVSSNGFLQFCIDQKSLSTEALQHTLEPYKPPLAPCLEGDRNLEDSSQPQQNLVSPQPRVPSDADGFLQFCIFHKSLSTEALQRTLEPYKPPLAPCLEGNRNMEDSTQPQQNLVSPKPTTVLCDADFACAKMLRSDFTCAKMLRSIRFSTEVQPCVSIGLIPLLISQFSDLLGSSPKGFPAVFNGLDLTSGQSHPSQSLHTVTPTSALQTRVREFTSQEQPPWQRPSMLGKAPRMTAEHLPTKRRSNRILEQYCPSQRTTNPVHKLEKMTVDQVPKRKSVTIREAPTAVEQVPKRRMPKRKIVRIREAHTAVEQVPKRRSVRIQEIQPELQRPSKLARTATRKATEFLPRSNKRISQELCIKVGEFKWSK